MPSNQSDHLEYTTNEWLKEPFTTILQMIFSNENITNFIDIGANVGGVVHSLDVLQYTSKINKIVCFEPDIDNYTYLTNVCENIKKSKDIDITCHNIGIFYGKNEAQVFGTGDGNVGGYFIHDDTINDIRTHPVIPYTDKIFHLDIIEKYIDFEIDVVKIDIEGSEINVLENSTILKNSKFIILEWHFKTEYLFDFISKNLSNFEIIYDGGNTNYLLQNKNRI